MSSILILRMHKENRTKNDAKHFVFWRFRRPIERGNVSRVATDSYKNSHKHFHSFFKIGKFASSYSTLRKNSSTLTLEYRRKSDAG